mgnify:CR=1 FL=1
MFVLGPTAYRRSAVAAFMGQSPLTKSVAASGRLSEASVSTYSPGTGCQVIAGGSPEIAAGFLAVHSDLLSLLNRPAPLVFNHFVDLLHHPRADLTDRPLECHSDPLVVGYVLLRSCFRSSSSVCPVRTKTNSR